LELMAKFITIIGLGMVELWAAIPAGTALNLHPFLNGLASGLGAFLGALLVIIFGDGLRNWLLKKKDMPHKNEGQIYRIWDKYGVIGLGMLSPLITGVLFGAAIGISLGAPPKRLLFWMCIGITVWTIVLTIISTLGFTVFENIAD